jgi:hypothetical protein
MEVTELRLNNLVSLMNEVFPLTKKRFVRVLEGMYEVEPVKITDKHLKFLGFDKRKNVFSFENSNLDFKIEFWKGKYVAMVGHDHPESQPLFIDMEYVHQVQNLVYDIRGKELVWLPRD